MGTECNKVLSVLLFAQIAPHCPSPSKNPCSTEHQTHTALQTHVNMCVASSKSAFRFLNRSNAQEFKHVLVCTKHFSDHAIKKNEKQFWLIKKIKHVPFIASPSQMLVGRQSKFSENLQRQEYFRKISWKYSRNRIASQLSLDDINEKQMKSLGEGSFLEKEHLQKLLCGIPIVTHFFFVD